MSADISAVYSEFTEAMTDRRGVAASQGRARRSRSTRLQRVGISSGGRNGIQQLGSQAKRRSLGPPFAVALPLKGETCVPPRVRFIADVGLGAASDPEERA
jgi:hypothetical protein